MQNYVPTDEVVSAYARLMKAEAEVTEALAAFEAESVRAIDDIANWTGKPIWNKNAEGAPFVGCVVGYMFDYDPDEAMLIAVGALCEADDGTRVEVLFEDMVFSEPFPVGGGS